MSQIKIKLLLVLSVAAIMITGISTTSYINTAQAQTTNQSSSSSPLPSNASSDITTRQQGSLPNSNLSNITGSISLKTTISEAISSKVKTNLGDAVTIAQTDTE